MFFFDESLETFQIFSLSQVIAVSVIVLAIAGIFIFKKQLRNDKKLDRRLRIGFAVTMLSMQAVFYVWLLAIGRMTLEQLPFGVCHLSMYFTSLALLLDSEKIFRIIFPWAILGALSSLLIADLTFDFPHFRFFHYFGNHGMFLIANLYLVVVRGFTFTYKDLLRSALCLFLFSVAMYFVNPWLGTNHMFMARLPVPVQPVFYWLGDPWWVPGFMFSMFLLFHVIYLLYRLLHRAYVAKA